MNERAVVFGRSAVLVGVLTEASEASPAGPPTAVILINAGMVHHVGPHRLYVDLARRFAGMGFVALRFDHSGIGDSGVREDRLAFEESSVLEVQEAMNWLSRECGAERFVLLGLCSGTLTAFRTAICDHRVVGLALLTALLEDPGTVSEATIQEAVDRKIARSYTTQKAFSMGSWKKLLAGKANVRRIVSVLLNELRSRLVHRSAKPAARSQAAADLRTLLEREVAVIFIFSEPTTVLEYFRMTVEPFLPELGKGGRVDLHVLKRSDHTFSRTDHRKRVNDVLADWLGSSDVARACSAATGLSTAAR